MSDQKAKILIVEDNSIDANELKSMVAYAGHNVVAIARNYNHAIELITEHQPNLILLDINLHEKKNGIDIAKYINKNFNIPFIYLTADSNPKTIAKAKLTNPVGYFIKPYRESDIKANIEIALYKAYSNEEIIDTQNKIDLGGGYYFDTVEQQLYYKALKIKLTKRERDLLKLLLNKTLVTYETIEYTIWGDRPVGLGALRTLVSRLNEKLNFKIESERGIGYKLV